MALSRYIKFWVGTEGPLLYPRDSQGAPLRMENPSTGEVKDVLTEAEGDLIIKRDKVTDRDNITSSEYSSYRAAHFNAFNNPV